MKKTKKNVDYVSRSFIGEKNCRNCFIIVLAPPAKMQWNTRTEQTNEIRVCSISKTRYFNVELQLIGKLVIGL